MLAPPLDVNKADQDFLMSTDVKNYIFPYKLLHKKKIGAGSFGNVYRVVVDDGKKTVLALKVSKNKNKLLPHDFIREIGILKRISESTSRTGVDRLVHLVGLIIDKDNSNSQITSMFTPFYELGNLSSFLSTKGFTLTVPLIRQMCIDLFSMLEQLHAHDIIHRDFKSGNIVISKSMRLVLVDFGQSVILRHRYEMTGRTVTTLHVRAPEIICGSRSYDCQVDVHACACVMWEILMGGQRLFPSMNSKNIKGHSDKKFFMIYQIYYLLGSQIRDYHKNREFSKIHRPTVAAIQSLPSRNRHVEDTFYRRYNRTLKLRQVTPLNKRELTQACSMVNSLLFWFPFERQRITRKSNWRQKIAFLKPSNIPLNSLEKGEPTEQDCQSSIPTMDISRAILPKTNIQITSPPEKASYLGKRKKSRGGKKIKRRKLNSKQMNLLLLFKKTSRMF